MPTVIPVKFTFAMRDLWFDPAESGAKGGDRVICVTERGTEMGVATADPFEVPADELKETIGDAELKPVDRVATETDLEYAEELAAKGKEALPVFKKLVKESELDMKPVGVEYLFGGERTICYFVADERVDFRQLVRDLSRALHERIDMRQIGVREEAAYMGGFAHCGQELCCARLGCGFEPVSIRMAKEQDLPLNSPKISGQCGRLMCCLRYEFEAYKDFKARAPKRNAAIETPFGEARVVDYNTPKEEVGMRLENGKTIKVPLSGMTCSECACKKSEQTGCPCRPDVVPRATLDALDAPDVQMALSQLDRENGVEPEVVAIVDEAPLVSDRRKRHLRERDEKRTYEVETTVEADVLQGKRRRKRRGSEQPSEAPAETRERRQRREPRPEEQPAATDEAPRVSRRRHHVVEGEAPAATEEKPAKKPQRATRKPGDRGGAPAPEAENAESEGKRQNRRRRSNKPKAENGEQRESRPESDEARQDGQKQANKSRRRRSNKPKTEGENAPKQENRPAQNAEGEGGEKKPRRRSRGRRKPKGDGGQGQAPTE